jgi:murein peptide amidase A
MTRAAVLGALAVTALAVAPFGKADASGRSTLVLGRSVDGRPIRAFELGDVHGSRSALIVGCIHGNECGGIAIAQALAQLNPPPDTDLWVVPNLNPDGAAAATRGNARGVDLNRNFPWRWRRLFAGYDSGPRPLSEPESRIAYRLLTRIRPTVSIWFHQHLNLVDDPAQTGVAERFATAAGLRLGSLPREPGSLTTWESHCLPGGAAFVVELPAGRLVPARALRFARAVESAVASAPARRPGLVTRRATCTEPARLP